MPTIDDIIIVRDDIVYFAENFIFLEDSKEPVKLYPKQKEILKAWEDNKYNVHISTRQFGSTILQAIFLIYKSLFAPNYNSIIFLHNYDTTEQFRRFINNILDRVPLIQDIRQSTKEGIQFSSGNRIKWATYHIEPTCGYNFKAVIFSNPDYIQPAVMKDSWMSILPCISLNRGSSIILSGTPKSPDGELMTRYNKLLADPRPGCATQKSIWSDIPSHDEEWKKQQEKILGCPFEDAYGM